MKGLHMLTKVLHPIRAELSKMDCTGLREVLGLDMKELSSRIQGGTEFTITELMAVALWLDRPMSVFFAPFECLIGAGNKLKEREP